MALAYRAHFAFIQRPIMTSAGVNTSALFGFTSTLLDLFHRHQPTHMAVAFDTDVPTERHVAFPDYKGTRHEMPEDLSMSLPTLQRLIDAFRIPAITCDGYEADDIIGTLAMQAAAAGMQVSMVTPDKDFGQLVSAKIRILKPGYKGGEEEWIGPDEVIARWDVAQPTLVTDMLGLCGDASDNIPGVPGVGPKTAAKLLREFGSLEGVLENLASQKGKLRDNLEQYADQARLSKRLATINTATPVSFCEETLRIKEPDAAAVEQLFDELEFRTLKKRFLNRASNNASTLDTQASIETLPQPGEELFEQPPAFKRLADIPHSYRVIDAAKEPKEVELLLEMLATTKEFCFDFETTALDPLTARPLGLALCWKSHEAVYVVLPENADECRKSLRPFNPLFTDPDKVKVGQNLKYDLSILMQWGIEPHGPFADTMLAHALLDPDGRHGMDAMARNLLHYEPIPFESVAIIEDGVVKTEEIDQAALAEYAAEDADITLQLHQILLPRVTKASLDRVLHEIENPLVPVLARMECTGIRVDPHVLGQVGEELETQIRATESAIFELAGHSFAISSPKQLGVVLFEEMKLADKPKKTATGQYSTNEQTLQILAGRHPIVSRVLEYREAVKLKNTYVDTLPSAIHPRTGRVHTSFAQLQTATGRLASSQPNLQNIPVRSELGRSIRKAFVPGGDDEVLLSADYSQIELRIIAALSQDEGLLEAFAQGLDIHTATAAKIFDVEEANVTREMRAKAKMVNFGIPYGISPFGLAQRLGCSRTEAAELIDNYFNRFPGVRTFMERTLTETRRKGYVETVAGRRRVIRDINSRNAATRSGAERNAINTPIQGTAADMIKLAMIRVDMALQKSSLRARLLLQVHDELLFEVATSEASALAELVTQEMGQALEIGTPLVVETGTGKNWLDAH